MTENEMQQLQQKIEEIVSGALNELMEVKMIRENDPTEFSMYQHKLQQLDAELDMLLETAKPGEVRDALIEAHERVNQVRETLVRGI
ncbi:hypothetical protein [Desertibacillus haloalkaliphilus]|uniref:hypothetical protein n=1 Tax=Desertibacillus haloalkaliphilus TaxID=1328930 RepID=UPI001C27562E|nr:hypothetical protein [Desertibacillus haloalkaliphilus]MBU8907973.1 hypothetical protein [Desertibacillus haloalkaliphilus]